LDPDLRKGDLGFRREPALLLHRGGLHTHAGEPVGRPRRRAAAPTRLSAGDDRRHRLAGLREPERVLVIVAVAAGRPDQEPAVEPPPPEPSAVHGPPLFESGSGSESERESQDAPVAAAFPLTLTPTPTVSKLTGTQR